MKIHSKGDSLREQPAMTLNAWLSEIESPNKSPEVTEYSFMTNEHFDEYIQSIGGRSDGEVLKLIQKFLIPSGSLGVDRLRLDSMIAMKNIDPEMFMRMFRLQYYKRLILYAAGADKILPWEGITWILDLLPHFPKAAIEALNAYSLAHIQLLPDGRIHGLSDACGLIRAKFIGLPGTQNDRRAVFYTLSSREFECLVESLYHEIGYTTLLTPQQKDGGNDIIAIRETPGEREVVRIECKRYQKPVGVEILRSLLGVVSSEKATKGIVVSSSHFTKTAKQFSLLNPRLDHVDGDLLARLLNEHLGPSWPIKIDRILRESLQRAANALPTPLHA